MNTLQKALLIAVFATACMLISTENYRDDLREQERYCDMRSIFESSKGKHGWPPFKPEIQCKTTSEELK